MADEFHLLDYLHALHPITTAFRTKLLRFLEVLDYKPMKELLRLHRKADKAWWLVEGYVVALEENTAGEEEVLKLFYPGQIVTNLSSFISEENSTFRLVAIGAVKVQELSRPDFLKLKIYPETNELLAKVAIWYKFRERQRLQALLLPIPERVSEFLAQYPVAGLPDQYAASWLRISVAEYRSQIAELAAAGIQMREAHVSDFLAGLEQNLARKVEAYLKLHYANHKLTHLSEVARVFKVSGDKISRHFQKEFDKSVAVYTKEFRMAEAKSMLLKQHKVQSIAGTLGYSSEYNFRRDFKAFFKVTTSQMLKDLDLRRPS